MSAPVYQRLREGWAPFVDSPAHRVIAIYEGLPVPGAFVIGKDRRGALAHVDADYRARLEPSEAIAAAREVAGC